jgi:molybdopterin/thiamine biosynthesis adenylyltransferase
MFPLDEFLGRNIGVITPEEQNRLQRATVAIFGVGGLGGVIAEILCRCGVGHLKLIEPDIIEMSNLNRHIFGFQRTVNKKKIEVAETILKQINPEIIIDLFETENNANLDVILKRVTCAVLAVDKIQACLMISRKAFLQQVPLVEGWAIPYANARVFTTATPTLEAVYQLPTSGRDISTLTQDDIHALNLQMLYSLKQIEGVESLYSDSAKARIAQGINPSFAPFVWLTAVLMTIETIKVLLDWDNIALAPNWALYNPLNHSIPNQESDRRS